MSPTTVNRMIRFLVIFIIFMSLILAAEIAIIHAKNIRPGTPPNGMVWYSEVT